MRYLVLGWRTTWWWISEGFEACSAMCSNALLGVVLRCYVGRAAQLVGLK